MRSHAAPPAGGEVERARPEERAEVVSDERQLQVRSRQEQAARQCMRRAGEESGRRQHLLKGRGAGIALSDGVDEAEEGPRVHHRGRAARHHP